MLSGTPRSTSQLHGVDHTGRSPRWRKALGRSPCGSLGLMLQCHCLAAEVRVLAASPVHVLGLGHLTSVARLHIGVDSDLNHVLAAPVGSARSPWSTNQLQVRLQRAARLSRLARPSPRVLGKLPQPCSHQRRACARAARLRSRPLPTRVNRLTAAPTSVSLAAAMVHVDESEPYLSGSGASRPRSTRW